MCPTLGVLYLGSVLPSTSSEAMSLVPSAYFRLDGLLDPGASPVSYPSSLWVAEVIEAF